MTISKRDYDWHTYFLDMCSVVAIKSKDRSTKVGAIIVGPDNEIRTTGYNGFPRGVNDEVDSRHERPEKYLWTIHAEQNAICAAALVGTPTKGCKMYVGLHPCSQCTAHIINAGITEIVIDNRDVESKKAVYERYADDFVKAKDMLKENGTVAVTMINKD